MLKLRTIFLFFFFFTSLMINVFCSREPQDCSPYGGISIDSNKKSFLNKENFPLESLSSEIEKKLQQLKEIRLGEFLILLEIIKKCYSIFMFPSTFVAQIMGQTRSEKPEQSHVHFHHQQRWSRSLSMKT